MGLSAGAGNIPRGNVWMVVGKAFELILENTDCGDVLWVMLSIASGAVKISDEQTLMRIVGVQECRRRELAQ